MLMTLENTLLEKLSEWQPSPGRHELHVADGGWSATVTADRSDALGCLLWELRLQRDGTAEIDVQKWAVAAAERVSGLMQPLKVVEVDALRNQAQLRSDCPAERGGKRLYHELLLSGIGHAVLRRFQTTNGTTGREQVAFAVTHEAVARLAGDVASAAAE
jgi:hypothetical protein